MTIIIRNDADMIRWVLKAPERPPKLVGFGCECAADAAKFAFRLDAANKGKFITHGLWRFSRHPNYFGEILIWSSTALAVSVAGLRATDYSLLWAWLSPAFTALLLLRVSGIPMVEAAGEKKWGDDPRYRHYVEHTSALVPWFPAPALSPHENDPALL